MRFSQAGGYGAGMQRSASAQHLLNPQLSMAGLDPRLLPPVPRGPLVSLAVLPWHLMHTFRGLRIVCHGRSHDAVRGPSVMSPPIYIFVTLSKSRQLEECD